MAISSYKPKTVLVIGFVSIILLQIAVVITGLQRMVAIDARMEQVVNEHGAQASLTQQMISASRERSILLHKMLLTNDPFVQDEYVATLYERGGHFIRAREQLMALELQEDEVALLDEQASLAEKSSALQYQIIEMNKGGKAGEALHFLYYEAIPAQDQVLLVLDKLAALQTSHSLQALAEADEYYRSARRMMVVMGVVALFLSVAILVYMMLRITSMTSGLRLTSLQLAAANENLEEKIKALSRTQEELYNSEARERVIRENMLDAVITIDERGNIDSCNPAAEGMFGYSADELTGRNISILMPEPYRSQHDDYVSKFMYAKQDGVLGRIRDLLALHKDGSTFPVDIGITRVELDGRTIVVGILRDITLRKQAEEALQHSRDELELQVKERTRELMRANEQLKHMANYDSLTDLPNRALFHEHLKLAAAHARRSNQLVAILFLDLDGFKQINDEFGHEAGDQVLKEMAKILKRCVREEDTVARIGGDEFVLVLGGLSHERYAARVSEKILSELGQPIVCGDVQVSIGVSIGISIYPTDSDDLQVLLKEADDAMYRVKKSGKNHFEFFHGYENDGTSG